jgi:hypothetical protein
MSRLTAPIARFLPFWGARWVERNRWRHRRIAGPISSGALGVLEPFFPAETLAAARIAIVPRLSLSRMLGLARRLGISALDADRILGITFLDTIVVPEHRSDPAAADGVPLSTLFHELVHVEQARQLGARGFVERYVRGWLDSGRTYQAIPLERDAYALARRFQAAPNEPFDVAREVARLLAEA